MTQRAWVFPMLVGVALLVSWPFSWAGFAWVPAPLFLAIILVYTLPHPVRWLTALAVVVELFTALPLGVMTAAIFLPYGMKKLARRVETDFSIWFFLYITLVVALQVTLLSLSYGLAAVFRSGGQASLIFFPWPMSLVTILATAMITFTLLIIRSFSLPSPWTR